LAQQSISSFIADGILKEWGGGRQLSVVSLMIGAGGILEESGCGGQEAGENVGKYTNLFYVNLGLSEPLFFYPKVSHTRKSDREGKTLFSHEISALLQRPQFSLFCHRFAGDPPRLWVGAID
jgi:hypothetical protein